MRCAAIVCAGVICLLLAPSHAGAVRKEASSSLTISVLWTVLSDRLVRDVPPKKRQSRGDVSAFNASLTNHVPQFGQRSGALVGVEHDTATVLSARAIFLRCEATLPGGRIFFAGRIAGRGAFHTLPVTGGTGRYARARGSVTSEDIGRLVSVETFRLRLP